MRDILKTFLKIFPIFFTIIFLATWGLLNGYFEQDEWLAIASAMKSYNLPWWNPFVAREMHFSPLGILFWSTLYKIFHLQAQYFFLTELIVHASVSTLVFILTARLTNNKIIAAITGLLFLLNGRAHQAFTHLAIFHVTDSAMFFILLFFIYLSGIKEKLLSLKKVIILFLIFVTTVFFREEGFIIIPILITYLFAFDRSKINKNNLKYFCLFTAGVIIILFGRFLAQVLNVQPITVQNQITETIAIYNLATIPVKFVVQNLIWDVRLAYFFVDYHQNIYPGMVENIFNDAAPLMDAAFFYIFSIIACISALWLWALRPKRVGLLLVFLASWIFSNAFMLSFAWRPLYSLEPRYLYFSAFPVFCFVAIFMYTLYTSKSKLKIVNFAKKTLVVALFVALLLTSFQEIRIAVKRQVDDGLAKKKVLTSLRQVHPTLSKNTIFYVQCRIKCYRNSELGIPLENVLPFGSGPGMIILVMYSVGNEREWGPFFTNYFLFHTFAEDYKKIEDRSFGYFTTKSKLEETLKKYNLPKDIVVALEINEENYTFRDISNDFRETLYNK